MTEPGDVLDSGTPGRSGRWIAAAVLAVLALVGWNLLGPDPDVDRAVESHSVDEPAGWEAGPTAETSTTPGRVDQLTFVDDQHGFLVQYLCSQSTGGDPCPRRMLATDDGGSSWEARATTPAYADSFYPFMAESRLALTLVDHLTMSSVARSFDGGRSWQERPISRAEPAAAPVGALLIQDVAPLCGSNCSGLLAWIDAAGRLHPLLSQPTAGPPAETLQYPVPASMGPDGDIVAGAVADSAGLVSMSTDGGRTWIDTRLEVPLAAGQAIQDTRVLAAGGGRAYAFVPVFNAVGVVATYGFRTDDGGATWSDLGFEDQRIWVPAGVLDGELISTDLPGRILLSSAGGTRWAEAGGVAGGPYLSQQAPDGPVLAAVPNSQGYESYHLSTDGRTWTPVSLPEV